MLWVGGGIIVHGLEEYGLAGLGHGIHAAAEAVAHALPASVAGAAEWLVSAAAAGVVGLALGAALIPLVQHVVTPALARLKASREPAGARAIRSEAPPERHHLTTASPTKD